MIIVSCQLIGIYFVSLTSTSECLLTRFESNVSNSVYEKLMGKYESCPEDPMSKFSKGNQFIDRSYITIQTTEWGRLKGGISGMVTGQPSIGLFEMKNVECGRMG